jgi:hypothetical protein
MSFLRDVMMLSNFNLLYFENNRWPIYDETMPMD